MTGGPIPGWAPGDERTITGDPARRPIGAVVSETFGAYRRRWRPILALAAIVEVPLALISVPYFGATFGVWLELVQTFPWPFPGGGSRSTDWLSAFSDSYADLLGPSSAISGGLATVSTLLSFVLLSALLGAMLLDGPGSASVGGALRAIGRRFVPLAGLCLVLVVVAIVLVFVWSALWFGAFAQRIGPQAASSPEAVVGSLLATSVIEVATVAAIAAGYYIAARCAVAIQALVLDGDGLPRAIGRSVALTHRRVMHVLLALFVTALVVGLGTTAVYLLAGLTAWWSATAGGGPLLVFPIVVFVLGRVLLAPILPLLTTVLYRDLRDAGPLMAGHSPVH